MACRWHAKEYHRDADKELNEALSKLPKEISDTVFLMLLYQKADAIRYVGHVIFKLLAAGTKGLKKPTQLVNPF